MNIQSRNEDRWANRIELEFGFEFITLKPPTISYEQQYKDIIRIIDGDMLLKDISSRRKDLLLAHIRFFIKRHLPKYFDPYIFDRDFSPIKYTIYRVMANSDLSYFQLLEYWLNREILEPWGKNLKLIRDRLAPDIEFPYKLRSTPHDMLLYIIDSYDLPYRYPETYKTLIELVVKSNSEQTISELFRKSESSHSHALNQFAMDLAFNTEI